jgi:hypothetical protein
MNPDDLERQHLRIERDTIHGFLDICRNNGIPQNELNICFDQLNMEIVQLYQIYKNGNDRKKPSTLENIMANGARAVAGVVGVVAVGVGVGASFAIRRLF